MTTRALARRDAQTPSNSPKHPTATELGRPDPFDSNDRIYTAEEAALLMGVHTLTIYQWIKRGRLNATRPGKEHEIRMSDLRACGARA